VTQVLAWALEDPRLLEDPDFTHVEPLWIGVILGEDFAFRVWGQRLVELAHYATPGELAVEWTTWAEEMGLELRPELLVCEVGDTYLNDLHNEKISHLQNLVGRVIREGERVPWYT